MTPAWLKRLMRMPVTICERIAATDRDEYGNVVYDTTPVRDSLCFLQPVAEVEIQLGRAGVGTFLLHLPATDADVVDAFSSFVVGGLSYEAIGPPATPSSLIRTGVDHLEIQVQRSSS